MAHMTHIIIKIYIELHPYMLKYTIHTVQLTPYFHPSLGVDVVCRGHV
jgi:hypothetical protein